MSIIPPSWTLIHDPDENEHLRALLDATQVMADETHDPGIVLTPKPEPRGFLDGSR